MSAGRRSPARLSTRDSPGRPHGPEWHSTPRGAHFLSRALAARLVGESDLGSGELAFDLGAGHGAITAAIAEAGARVVAVERDPKLVGRLERRFSGNSLVRVVHADVRTVPLPRKPFRVVANIPFGVTTELLRRLLDSPVNAADIVVAAGVCTAVTADRPGNIRVLRWATRYSLRRGLRLPAHCFRPPPSVDAATLVIRRRPEPLLKSADQRRAFDALLAAGYRHADRPWERSVSGLLTHRQAVRIAASRDLPLGTAARELSVHDWVAAAEIVAR